MSLRTRLRIAIIALVALVVIALSVLYLADFTRAAFQNASGRARLVADNVKSSLLDRFDQQLHLRPQQPATLEEYKQAWTEIVRTDPLIASVLQRSRANAYTVVNIAIAGEDGTILAAADPSTVGTKAPALSDIEVMENKHEAEGLADLFRLRRNYAVLLPLGVPGEQKPVFTVVVMVGSLFLRHSLEPAFRNLGIAFIGSLFIAVLLAYLLPVLALRPLERVSRKIDQIRTGEFASEPQFGSESREFAAVQTKLNLLGQQFRGAREDALALRTNIDQLLKRLEETVLLFDEQGRLVVAGRMVEQLFGRAPKEMLGHTLDEIFPASSGLGFLIRESVSTRRALHDTLITLEDAHDPAHSRILVNIEPLEEAGNARAGVLVRLRDAESRRQLQRQLDLSSRLAAISRLTGGVAHEIKNPLNAIALHLEILKTKLDGGQPEIGVISREIERLDRVVKTFLDFNRPVDLQMREFDLVELTGGLVSFLAPQAQQKNVAIEADLPGPLRVRGDPELLRQAILNVMVNGLEAAGPGGRLRIHTQRTAGNCELAISDDGPGIPPDVQRKIFNLYFTTKANGSGIGLAMTFRLIQLHGGTIDVFSEQGHAATFRIRSPQAATESESVSSTDARS